MVYIMLAKGFEEIEALTVCDVLRRAGIACALVSQEKAVTGAHGITVNADILIGEVDLTALDAIVLPGGMPGVDNLENDAKVQDILKFAVDNDLLVCAICAAPRILGNAGYLQGKKAVCYPSFEKYLTGADVSFDSVMHDANFITSRGMGTAMDFAFEIVATLKDDATAGKISKGIIYEQADNN